MLKERFLPVFMTAALSAILSACGASSQEAQVPEEEIVLAPLEEKKLSPLEEKEIATPEPDSVGNMMVYPTGYGDSEMGCLYGTNTITFYFENEGVVGGDGLIHVYESPSGAAFSSVSTASSNVTVSPMDEAGTLYTGWEKGTKIDVCFDTSFDMGKNYYVLLDPGAFRLNEVLSKSITSASLISFGVKDYGFEPFSTDIANGDSFNLDLKLGGDAVSASVDFIASSKGGVLSEAEAAGTPDASVAEASESGDAENDSPESGAVTIASETFKEDGVFSPDLSGFEDSAVAFKVSYFDSKGSSIDSSTFVLSVGFPMPDDLANVKSSAYGLPSAEDTLLAEDAEFADDGIDYGDDTASVGEDLSEPSAESLEVKDSSPEASTADTADASSGDTNTDTAKAAVSSDSNFKAASVSERIHSEVDKALSGRELTRDEKGALIVDTLNALASEGFVKEGTPFYDKNSESVTYVDANGKREKTRI